VRANGFPEGTALLGHDESSREVVIARR